MNYNMTLKNIILKLNYRDLIIFIFPVMIFLFYLYVYNPGILTFDSFNQLHQIATGSYTNGQPFFHTFIEIICIKIFGNIISIGILQIFIFSLMWMIICKYHRDETIESSNQFVLQFAVTFIISLLPINAINSITLSSYILFSYFLMFLCFLIKIMIDKNGQVDLTFTTIMALTIAFIFGLNTYGIYVAIITLIIVAAYLFRKNKTQKMHITLLALALVFILLISSLSIIYNVSDDDLNGQINQNNEINLEKTKNQYFSSIDETPTDSLENPTAPNFGNNKYNFLNSFVIPFQENIILNTLFSNSVLFLIFSIILLFFIYSLTKLSEIYLISTPILLNTIIILVSNSFHINNYLYGNVLVCYLIIIILLNIWSNPDSYLKSHSKNTLISKNQEYVDTAYTNSNEVIHKDVEFNENIYEEIESEIEELSVEEIKSILVQYSNEESTSENIETKNEEMNMEETNIDLEETSNKKTHLNVKTQEESKQDLITQILKEMEIEKENK